MTESTEVPLDRLALGCEQLGGTDWGEVDAGAAMDAVRHAWEIGFRWFDTADVYGLGVSESRLSEALGSARHEAGILTKFGVRWEPSADGRATTWRDSSPAYLRGALDASLRRLDIDCIPIYLVHWPAQDSSLEDTIAALEQEQQAGRIGRFGVSNHRGDLLDSALSGNASVVELPLNLVDRSARSSMNAAKASGADVWAYGVLAQGLLTGRYGAHSRFPSSDRRSRLSHFSADSWRRNSELLRRVANLADRCGSDPVQVAVQWVLAQPYVTRAIVGARSRAQVNGLAAGLCASLPADDLAALVSDQEIS